MGVNPSFNSTCFVVEWVTVIASCLFVFFGEALGPPRLPIRFLRLGQDFRAVRQWDGDWKINLGGFTLGAHHRMSFLIPMIYTSDVSESGFFWMFLVSTVYSCYLIHLDPRTQ